MAFVAHLADGSVLELTNSNDRILERIQRCRVAGFYEGFALLSLIRPGWERFDVTQ